MPVWTPPCDSPSHGGLPAPDPTWKGAHGLLALDVLSRTGSYATPQNRRTVTPMKTNRTPAPPGAQEPETLEGNLRLWDELNKLEDPELWDRIAELAAEAGN